KYNELLDENVHSVKSPATGIDLKSQTISLANQQTLNYDVLVLTLGGITNYVGVEGAEEFSKPFRKLEHADNLRALMVAALDRIPPDMPPLEVRNELTFAVVGGGASGCEL